MQFQSNEFSFLEFCCCFVDFEHNGSFPSCRHKSKALKRSWKGLVGIVGGFADKAIKRENEPESKKSHLSDLKYLDPMLMWEFAKSSSTNSRAWNASVGPLSRFQRSPAHLNSIQQ